MGNSLEDGDDGAVDTDSNCSYEETAAKIEKVLRRNLRLDVVDAAGANEKQLTQPTVGTSCTIRCCQQSSGDVAVTRGCM